MVCHQAILTQHSPLLRDILQRTRCCVCQGAECYHKQEVTLILDQDVDIPVLEGVLDIIYRGEGRVPENAEEFQMIINMLQLDSFYLKNLVSVGNENTPGVIRNNLKLSESMSGEDQGETSIEFSSHLTPD